MSNATVEWARAKNAYAQGYTSGRATALLAVLVALNILNFIDRQLLQSFVVDVRRDLELSYFQFSLLTGLFFSFSYTLAGLVMGALADRINRPRLMAGGLCVWSALTAASGLATNFFQLATARAFVALGEATLSPSALSMLSDAFPDKRRGLASGLFYLGIPLGAGGSLLVAGLLGPILGWRNCFLILGGLGVLASLAVLLLRDPPRRSATAAAVKPPPLSRAAADVIALLKRSVALRYLLIGATLVIFSQGALVLDQAWLVEERGYQVSRAQTTFGLLFLLAGVCGAAIGGQLSDLCQQRFQGGRLLFLGIGFAIIGPISITYRLLSPDTPLFYFTAAIGSLAIMLPFGAIISAASELAPARSRATVIALTILVMALFGTAGGNAFAGWLSDQFIAAGHAQPLTWALMATSAVSLLAVPMFLLGALRYQRGVEVAHALENAETPGASDR